MTYLIYAQCEYNRRRKGENEGVDTKKNGISYDPAEIRIFYESSEIVETNPRASHNPAANAVVFEGYENSIHWYVVKND